MYVCVYAYAYFKYVYNILTKVNVSLASMMFIWWVNSKWCLVKIKMCIGIELSRNRIEEDRKR